MLVAYVFFPFLSYTRVETLHTSTHIFFLTTPLFSLLVLSLALVPGVSLATNSKASFLRAVSPGSPGERDALVHLDQSHIVVVELGYISVFECPGVVLGVDDHRLGNHSTLTWEPKRLLVIST